MHDKLSPKVALFYGIFTFVLWGFLPIYFKLLNDASPFEILAHRVFWSIFFLLFIVKYKKKFISIGIYLHSKRTMSILLCTSIIIMISWGTYIYAVSTGRILDASLGYFINPLFSMLLGAIILKEKLNLVSKISILLVFIAIGLQIYDVGKIPIISIILPASFAFYTLFKKILGLPVIEGLFIETLIIFPLSLIYIIFLISTHQSHAGFNMTSILLIFSGVVTVIPLLTFNIAANSLKMSTIGFIQYISPTLAMLVAVFIYGEPLNKYKLISFIIIWISLVLVSCTGFLRKKK